MAVDRAARVKRASLVPVKGIRDTAQSRQPQSMHSLPRHSIAQLATEPARVGRLDSARQTSDRLPQPLKSGIEALSGVSMGGVRVRYNSPHPARMGALAYARGREIHLAAGQERHLPHEAWHLVQQARGRVRPTLQLKGGVSVNDDQALEREADVMGARAAAAGGKPLHGTHRTPAATASSPLQMVPNWANLLLGVGGTALAGAAAIGSAPLWAGALGLGALGYGVKGAYDNRNAKKQEEKRKLDRSYKILHEREQSLLTRLRTMPPTQVRGRAEIEDDLERVEVSRRALTARTLAGGHELWLPDSVRGKDRTTAKSLWTSISGNRGNIKVDKSDPDFHVNALSDISKLLQSSHARNMLGRLDAPQHGGARRNIDIAPTLGSTDNAPKTGHPPDGHVGEGSKVSINYAEPSSYSLGTKGERIHSPTYIKLGHELGHASHYLAGTASGLGATAQAHGDPIEEELWTSQEEYNTITGEENPIRANLGLAKRRYHKDYGDIPRIRQIRPVQAELGRRYRQLDLSPRAFKGPSDVLDDAESWLHPENRWKSYPTHKLGKAAIEADRALKRLEKVAPRRK